MGNALSVARDFAGIWVPAHVTSSLCSTRPGWVTAWDPNDTDDLDRLCFLPAHDFWDFRYRSIDTASDQPGSERRRGASTTRGFVLSQLRARVGRQTQHGRPNGGSAPRGASPVRDPTPTRTRRTSPARRHPSRVPPHPKASQKVRLPRPPGLHFFLSFLFLFLLALSQTSDSTRVVFDDIGELAGAVSYTHVVVPINLRVTADSAIGLRKDLHQRFDWLITHIKDGAAKGHTITSSNDLARLQVVVAQLEDLDDVFDRLVSIRQYFPADFEQLDLPTRFNGTFDFESFRHELETATSDKTTTRQPRNDWDVLSKFADNLDTQYYGSSPLQLERLGNYTMPSTRPKRFLPFVPLVVGAAKVTTSLFSTIHGLYTRRELKQLRHDVTNLQATTRNVVRLTTANSVAITLLQHTLKEVEDNTANALLHSPAVHHAEVDRVIKGLHRAIDLMIQLVQEAQHNKLAAGFLRPEAMADAFKRVEAAAALSLCDMTLEQPEDLALVEVSFISDKDGAVLILHVPMIPHGTLLHLLRLHPFPIPLGTNYSLLPEVSVDVIGISKSGYSTEIRYSDLVDCHKIGRTYYCSKQNILTNQGTPSCLRALHDKDFDGALRLCELKVRPAAEAVIRLDHSQYLVYSPTSISAQRSCAIFALDATIDIPKGISTVPVPAGCSVQLKQHQIHSDTSVTVGDNHFSYVWDWESTVLRLDTHTNHLSQLAQDLEHHSGPVHLHDVLERSDELHQHLMDQTEFNRTLSDTTLAARKERNTNQILAIVGLVLCVLALFGLAFGAFYFRFQLRTFIHAVRYILRRVPPLSKWLKPPSSSSATNNNSNDPERLYPNITTAMWTELSDFTDLLSQQAIRLRRPREHPAIDV